MQLQNDVSPKDEKEQRLKWITTQVRLGDIKPYEHNPRFITVERWKLLLDQMQKHGYASLIQIDTDMTIISGHQRVKAFYEEYGWNDDEIVEVRMPERKLTEREFKEHLLACNKTAGEFDYDMLAGSFPEDIMKAAGFTDEEMGKIDELNSIDELDGDEQDDVVPDKLKNPVTVKGDVYSINGHRLKCGDSTVQTDVEDLLNGAKIDILLTDPPYGVDYSSKNEMLNKLDEANRVQKEIENDNILDYRRFFNEFLSIIPFSDYNTCYIFMSGLHIHNLRLSFEDCDMKWSDYLVWVKNNHVLGRKDYNAKYEFCMYGWKGKHKFHAESHRTTVLEYNKPMKNDLHPTMKPVELFSQLIKDGSKRGANVYDPFIGSGTTLIVAEKTNRHCFGMEFDASYCDVIIRRYIDFMKKNDRPVKLQRNGEIISTEIFEAKV